MTTQRIEEMVEELAERFCCNGLIQRMDGTHWTETELREEARQALTETHQAGKKQR